jgi:hypothetical protein
VGGRAAYSLATPGVRAFGVDCEPLGRRQLWLLTGLEEQLEALVLTAYGYAMS